MNLYETLFEAYENETEDEWIYRIGKMKEDGDLRVNWSDVMQEFNRNFASHSPYTDNTTVRKRFYALRSSMLPPRTTPLSDSAFSGDLQSSMIENEKLRQRVYFAKNEINKAIRTDARFDDFKEEMKRSLARYPCLEMPETGIRNHESVFYVLLSDVHYGISFSNQFGVYNSSVAQKRLSEYADAVIQQAVREGVDVCFLSVLGDMISGNIHDSIRRQNELNLCDQIVGASQLLAAFIQKLSEHFSCVFVNNVGGNHSRPDSNVKLTLRSERLDDVVYAFAQSRLENNQRVVFCNDNPDPTVAVTKILGKCYVAVHGDWESNIKHSALSLEHMLDQKIDYIVSGHFHHIEISYNGIPNIMSGSLCGSGDDYAVSKRLYGNPSQLFMTLTESGIQSLHPVIFSKD